MTLQERYSDLNQPLTMFNKTYPAAIEGEITVSKLELYAKHCYNSGIPALVNVAKEMNTNIFNAGYSLNGSI